MANDQEMLSVVKHYVNVRKQKEINIVVATIRDGIMLRKAYVIACRWFQENGLEIKFI